MYKIAVAASAFFILTAPSLAAESNFVRSLRADNGFEPPAALKGQHSFESKEMVGPLQTGSIGNAGDVPSSKCVGVSPREHDPLSPDCRN